MLTLNRGVSNFEFSIQLRLITSLGRLFVSDQAVTASTCVFNPRKENQSEKD